MTTDRIALLLGLLIRTATFHTLQEWKRIQANPTEGDVGTFRKCSSKFQKSTVEPHSTDTRI